MINKQWISRYNKDKIDLQWMKPVLKQLINNWMKEAIEKEGFELFQDNKMRYWYKKFSPEIGGNWYRYKMYWSVLIYDPEMEWLKICVDFNCEAHEDDNGKLDEYKMDTLFEGYCPDTQTFYTILKLIRMK